MRVLLIEHNEADVRVIREQLGERHEIARGDFGRSIEPGTAAVEAGSDRYRSARSLVTGQSGVGGFSANTRLRAGYPLVVLTAIDDDAVATNSPEIISWSTPRAVWPYRREGDHSKNRSCRQLRGVPAASSTARTFGANEDEVNALAETRLRPRGRHEGGPHLP